MEATTIEAIKLCLKLLTFTGSVGAMVMFLKHLVKEIKNKEDK